MARIFINDWLLFVKMEPVTEALPTKRIKALNRIKFISFVKCGYDDTIDVDDDSNIGTTADAVLVRRPNNRIEPTVNSRPESATRKCTPTTASANCSLPQQQQQQ